MGPNSVFVTGGSYLAVGVDSRGVTNSPARAGWNQVVEVLHLWGSTLIVEEGMLRTVASVRITDHLARGIYARCMALIASERSQVLHLHASRAVRFALDICDRRPR
jgi:hypothetical protein